MVLHKETSYIINFTGMLILLRVAVHYLAWRDFILHMQIAEYY